MPKTAAEVLELQRLEDDTFLEQAPEMRALLLERRRTCEALLEEIGTLRARRKELDSEVATVRSAIVQKRGAPPIDDAQAAAVAKKSKEELKETAAKAAGTFVGAMCKSYGISSTGEGASKKTKIAGTLKSGLKGITGGFKGLGLGRSKRDKSEESAAAASSPSPISVEVDDDDVDPEGEESPVPSPSAAGGPSTASGRAPRIVTMALDIPSGTVGACAPDPTGGSTVEISLTCRDPANQTIEDLASAGAKIELVFATRSRAEKGKTEELIKAAEGYFQQYFSEAIRAKGASPDVNIHLTDTTLTASGTCRVERDQVGGVMGRLQSIASGELDEATSQAVLGKYSAQHAKESLHALHHTSVAFQFSTKANFATVMNEDRSVNWRFFDEITGGAELKLERRVYRAVQKVVEMFSMAAATKMSVGGRFFKKLNFKVDPLFFKSLEEDPVLASYITDHLTKLLGRGVSIDGKVLQQLDVLEGSLSELQSFRFSLPLLTFELKLRGLDFFKVVNETAKTAAAAKEGATI